MNLKRLKDFVTNLPSVPSRPPWPQRCRWTTTACLLSCNGIFKGCIKGYNMINPYGLKWVGHMDPICYPLLVVGWVCMRWLLRNLPSQIWVKLLCWLWGLQSDITRLCCLYCNPDQDDRIFDCLPTSMAAVQAEDVPASFQFVYELNDNHHE